GYVSTTRALHHAEANVSLSLAAFEDLFNKLAARGELGPFAGGPKPPPPPGKSGRGPGPPSLSSNLKENDAEVLQSVLTFYDKFAATNQTHSRLQGEAARAQIRVAALYAWLGRHDDAAAAYARAADRFESLAASHPDVAEYRFHLARAYAKDEDCEADS